MSADVKLLPLPEHMKAWARSLADDAQAYARANMEPLIAENERLRAEVAGYANMVQGYIDTIAEADAQAERLAEALRELVEVFSESGMYDEEVFAKARAALDQEGGKGGAGK